MSGTDMRKIMEALSEDRVKDDDNVSYEMKGKNKTDTALGKYTQVTASLSGSKSAVFTKMAKQYAIIDAIAKRTTEKRNALNEQAKDAIKELFDAEDAAYTRYVDTVSLTITLAKDTEDATIPKETFDVKGFMSELYDVCGEELLPVFKALEEKYTKVEKKLVKGRPGALGKPKIKKSLKDLDVEESIVSEGIGDLFSKLKEWASKFAGIINRKLNKYDTKIDDLKEKYSV